MEYIRGHDLSETMRAIWKALGPPRPELVAYVGREACRGLAYAHNLTDENGRPLGMIHRDVSPSNVMLSYEGAVKMLDFGIAKALGDSADQSKSGTMKGKYAYMAPEQTEGDNIDHRSDIFACGIVLHEVLTGRRLFKGQNDVQTIERVRRCDVPPPSAQNPNVPPELDHIVLKALQRDPARRWSNAADMADALDDIVHGARFQPTHLQQILYDCFRPRVACPPATGQRSLTRDDGRRQSCSRRCRRSAHDSARIRCVPAVDRVGIAHPREFPSARWRCSCSGPGSGVEVSGGNRTTARPTAVATRPASSRLVKSRSTADIFLGEGKRPIGATPVTLPTIRRGVREAALRRRPRRHEQIVVDDTPLSSA
jgi:serine/threonine protein kinase